MLLRLDLTLYCQLSVLRKTLPFVMSCFCGIFGGSSLQIAFQPPLDSWGLCPGLCFTLGGEKSPHLLVDLHLPGAGSFHRPILCLATQFLRWPWLSRGGEKRGGTGGSPPHKVHGGQPGALLALPKGRFFLLFTLPLPLPICPAFYF